MHNKWIMTISVLLMLIVTFYLNNNAATDSQVLIDSVDIKSHNPAVDEVKNIDNKWQDLELKEKVKPVEKDEIDGVPLTQLLAEISAPVYSDDPVLEVISLSTDFRICKYRFYRLKTLADKNPQIKKLLDSVNSKCQAYASQYPLWFNVRDREESVLNLPATSIFGEQYKHILGGYYGKHTELDFNQLDAARLELSLQIKSPSLISFGALGSGIGISAPLDRTAFFMDMLHSKVGLWVYRAHEFALQSYSCDLPNSRSCAATSFYMVYKCENDEFACGLNFQQWYNSHTTAGMKKDVEILLQYYRDKYR